MTVTNISSVTQLWNGPFQALIDVNVQWLLLYKFKSMLSMSDPEKVQLNNMWGLPRKRALNFKLLFFSLFFLIIKIMLVHYKIFGQYYILSKPTPNTSFRFPSPEKGSNLRNIYLMLDTRLYTLYTLFHPICTAAEFMPLRMREVN